ncbi:SRPBCC domain-containing protein [Hanstruepera flava]|uniref:SRPBCC domain-containing protein n=1 Tax=Hanstruepera flava TaxID=2930218 RepID=UPI002027756A|nr:SRPBCC domain-containing protein [Hanstruepera flava]
MKKIEFKEHIKASCKTVYETMLGLNDITTYEQWTAEFNPTSTYEGSWNKGAKMYFIGTDENGKRGGMVSEIAENIPFEYVSIRHYGILDGDTEITSGEHVDSWAGGLENYSFQEHNGITTVTVEMDTADDYIDYFNNLWPKALNTLKKIVEG